MKIHYTKKNERKKIYKKKIHIIWNIIENNNKKMIENIITFVCKIQK